MNQAAARASRREIRRAVGPALLDTVQLHDDLLARLSRSLAATTHQHAIDAHQTAQHLETLDAVVGDLRARLDTARTACLQLGEEARRYVDAEDRKLTRGLTTTVTALTTFTDATLWQRLRWLLTGAR